jgi:hypothetical protein
MRSYHFYLYRADSVLTGRQVLTFGSDSQARAHAPAMFALHQDCDELELWEAFRHILHASHKPAVETMLMTTGPAPGREKHSGMAL